MTINSLITDIVDWESSSVPVMVVVVVVVMVVDSFFDERMLVSPCWSRDW